MSALGLSQLKSDQLIGKFFIAQVVNNQHPQKLARVRVYIPDLMDQADQANAPWAAIVRPAMRGANGAPGFFSIPRVGSRVLVVFDKGDLNSPIIMGELVDGQSTVGQLAVDYPNSWGYEDENGNVLITDLTSKLTTYHHSSGTQWTIDASGNMNVTVVANLKVTVSGDTTVQTSGNTTIGSGGNVAINAGGGLSLTAGAGTTIDSTGSLSVSAPSTNVDGGLTSNGVNVSSSHVHGGVKAGSDTSSTPQ